MNAETPLWWLTKDGDPKGFEMYRRHYSAKKNRSPKIRLFVGPGQKIILRTLGGDAFFAWRFSISDAGETGVSCAFFRNESEHQSSELIRQAWHENQSLHQVRRG